MTRLAAALSAPLLLAAAAFLLRTAGGRQEVGAAPGAAASVELPVPVAAPAPPVDAVWSFDAAQCRARFEVGGAFGPAIASCAVTGSLRWGAGGRPARIALRLHTSELRVESGGPRLAWDLLGSRVHSDVVYEGSCTETRTWAGTAAQRATFAGGLWFGSQHWRQELELWIAATRPGRVHLLGIGDVGTGGLALPQRYVLGVLPASSRIVLALDLACCSEDGKSR